MDRLSEVTHDERDAKCDGFVLERCSCDNQATVRCEFDVFALDEDKMNNGNTGRCASRYHALLGLGSDAENISDDSGNDDPVSRSSNTVNSHAQHMESVTADKTMKFDSKGSRSIPKQSGGREPCSQLGVLGYASSLPVTIPVGSFWPPQSLCEGSNERDCAERSSEESTVKTILPMRCQKDVYKEMREHARSIQAPDDPERLFGERPHRRRYKTREDDEISQTGALPHHENAVIVIAAGVSCGGSSSSSF